MMESLSKKLRTSVPPPPGPRVRIETGKTNETKETESKSVCTVRREQTSLFKTKLHNDLLLEMVTYLNNNDHAKLSQACFYLSNILSLDDGWGTAYNGKYYEGRRELTKGLKQLRQVTFRYLVHSDAQINRLIRSTTLLKTCNVDMIQHEDYKHHLPTEIKIPILPASVEIFKMNQILYVESFKYLFDVVIKNCSSHLKRLDIRVGLRPWVEWFRDENGLLKDATFNKIEKHSLCNLTHLVFGLFTHNRQTKCDMIKFQEYMTQFFSRMPNLIHLECHFSFLQQGLSVHHALSQGHFSHLQTLVFQCHNPMTIMDLTNLKLLTSLVIKETEEFEGDAPLQRYFLPRSLIQLHMTGVSSFPQLLLNGLTNLKHFEMNGQRSMKKPNLPGPYAIANACPNLETFVFHISHHCHSDQHGGDFASGEIPDTLDSWLDFFSYDYVSAMETKLPKLVSPSASATTEKKSTLHDLLVRDNRTGLLPKLKLFVVCQSEESFNRVKNKNQKRRKLQEELKTKIQKLEETDESDDELNALDDRLMQEEYLIKCNCGLILGTSATIEKFQKLLTARPNMQFVIRLDSVYMNTHIQDNCQVLKTQQDNNGWTPFCLSDYIPNPTAAKSHYEILT